MTLLKYTVPSHQPCYDDWEFRIHPGTFLLHVPPLMSIFQEADAHHRQHYTRANLEDIERCTAIFEGHPDTWEKALAELNRESSEARESEFVPTAWHADMLALMAWLDSKAASGVEVIEWDEWDSSQRDLVGCLASGVIYSRQFSSFRCPTCDMEYSPSEGSIAKWALGQDLAAHGGRRFICPRDHTLYASAEWIS